MEQGVGKIIQKIKSLKSMLFNFKFYTHTHTHTRAYIPRYFHLFIIYSFIYVLFVCLTYACHLFPVLKELVFLKVKVTQSCLTLCESMDSTVHGIL